MTRALRRTCRSAALAALALGHCAQAQQAGGQRWFWRTDLQGLLGAYSGSTGRESLANGGVFVHADYYERAGFTLGYNRTALGFERERDDVDQDTVFLSGRVAFTPDTLDGRMTLRLDAYDVANDAAMNILDSATAGTTQISYLNFARTFYWDVGFARSDYGRDALSGERLNLDQLTPTFGIAFNRQRDWLQMRAYLIDAAYAPGSRVPDDTAAVELKWTHWLPANGLLGLETIRINALAGERLLAVDHDAATIYNLSELQTGSISLGGEWRVGESSSVLIIAGIEDYENSASFDRYRNSFLYLNFSHGWN